MNRKMVSWKVRFLYQTKKFVLIKLNLTGIPQFTIQGIKIPSYIAKEIDKKNREFL